MSNVALPRLDFNSELGSQLRKAGIVLRHFDMGRQYVRCPQCAATAKHAYNRRARKLALEIREDGVALFFCNNCRWHGSVVAGGARNALPPAQLAQTRIDAAERKNADLVRRLNSAGRRWAMSTPAAGTATESYLRQRGYHGPIPATIRHLPATSKFPHAMIAAFGFADELEPGVLSIRDDAVHATHITRLLPDGSDRMRTGVADKLTPGIVSGRPIVIAPPNDGGGLAICEGNEDGLSVHDATGLGVWVAGCGPLMPALAAVVPTYVECVTIYQHLDEAGRRGAVGLAHGLDARDIEVRVVSFNVRRP